MLVRAECVRRQANDVAFILGISLSFFLLLSSELSERVIVGLQNFAWAPNSQKYQDSKQNKIRPPRPPRPLAILAVC